MTNKSHSSTIAKRRIAAVFLAMALSAPSLAADLQAGMAAERGEDATALEEWRPLAEQGDAEAQARLGGMYLSGQGVTQDYAEAVKWYRLAAEQGYADAQDELGAMYMDGQGVTQDYAEAARWYRLAAEQGETSAQFALGFMYNRGRGITQDYVQAHMWLNLAAGRMPPGLLRDTAAGSRDTIAKRMTPAQVAEAQRLAREWRPK